MTALVSVCSGDILSGDRSPIWATSQIGQGDRRPSSSQKCSEVALCHGEISLLCLSFFKGLFISHNKKLNI